MKCDVWTCTMITKKTKEGKAKAKKRKEKKLKKLTCSRLELWNFQYSPPLEWQPNQLRHIAFIASIEFFPFPFYGTIRDVSVKGAMSRGLLSQPILVVFMVSMVFIYMYFFILSLSSIILEVMAEHWKTILEFFWLSFLSCMVTILTMSTLECQSRMEGPTSVNKRYGMPVVEVLGRKHFS